MPCILPDENNFPFGNYKDPYTAKYKNYLDKLKAIVLIQIKIVNKYENMITILLSQFWGKEKRHEKCQSLIFEYIKKLEDIVEYRL